jgi:cytochrome P450
MTNPRVYAKLQREVDDAVRDGKAPPRGEGFVSSVQARQLPYLHAVIRESIRTRPPVVNIFSRDVPPAGDTVDVDGDSVFLPPGSCIGYSALPMHRSQTVYGKDARAFRPERWFESDANRLAEMVRTNNLIFGYGRFLCLGKTVAMIEVEKTLFEVS